MIANGFIESGHPIVMVLRLLKLSTSSYYYKSNGKRKGKKKSEYTMKKDGEVVSNEKVVIEIETLLSHEFIDYGYLKVTYHLKRRLNYVINAKKVYRLMIENQLLNKSSKKKTTKKNWVKELVPDPSACFDHLEIDFKFIYIRGANRYNRNAMNLTVIDVKSRWVLGQVMDWSLKGEEVIELFNEIFEHYDLPEKFYVRNDNGSQFIKETVQEYFEGEGIVQEFCKPATPQQNAHVESYHSIVERAVCQKFEFDDLKEAQQTMNRFVYFYNFDRIHSGVDYRSPYEYLLANNIHLTEQLQCPAVNCIRTK